MTNAFTLSVDTTPPGNPQMVLDGGVLFTASLDGTVHLTASGAADMKIWGDVDLTANVNIQDFETNSTWIPFTADTDVTFSVPVGRKRIYARVRDDLGNLSPVFGAYIDYDPGYPLVTIVVPSLVSRVSEVSGHDTASFSWEANHPFTDYEVRVMPTTASPYYGGSAIGIAHGSVNVVGTGSFPATTPITTTVKGADLQAASPGDGPVIIKVFVKDASGRWSP
jgi:hypothetical protein